MTSEDSVSWTRKANWAWKGRAVGGELTLKDEKLHFDPHIIDKNPSKFVALLNSVTKIFFGQRPVPNNEYDPATELNIEFDDIQSVEKEPPRQRGLKDTVYAGGLRSRMRIELEDGSEELFVISGLTKTIDELRSEIDNNT